LNIVGITQQSLKKMVPTLHSVFDGVEVSEGRRSQRNQWVALLMRGGNCTFLDKVRRAEEAGAAAVLIGNFLPNEVCRVVYSAMDSAS
jgi:hypothetical protein